MRPSWRVVPFALLWFAPALAAQTHEGAIGYGGGGMSFGSFTEGGGREVKLQDGWVASAQAERWYGSRRIGVRLNGAYTQRPLEGATVVGGDIDTWLLDGDVLLRPLPATEGGSVAPFVSVGAGVIKYRLGSGPPVVLEEANAVYPGEQDARFMVAGSAGVDVFPPRLRLFGTPLGFRLEAADHVALESPFEDVEGERFGPVHNLRFTLNVLGLIDDL